MTGPQQALLAVAAGATDPSFSSVVLLCHCDGTNGSLTFTDNSPLAQSMTNSGNASSISTASPKFGTGCANMSASSAIQCNAANSNFQFGAGQFTIEAWGNQAVTGGGYNMLNTVGFGGSNIGWVLQLTSNVLRFGYSTTGSNFITIGASFTPTINTWVAYAVDRDGSNVLRVYANGAVIASGAAAATFFAATQPCLIGNDGGSSGGWNGFLDEIRITKGVARYAGAYTPATVAFPDA